MDRTLQGTICLVLGLALTMPAPAQFKDQALGGGLALGANVAQVGQSSGTARLWVRGNIRSPLVNRVFGEIGLAGGQMAGNARDFRADLAPTVDCRILLAPFMSTRVSPFVYAGIGALYFDVKNPPVLPGSGASADGWTAFIPAGIGVPLRLSDNFALELSGGYNYSFSPSLDGNATGKNDGFWTLTLGIQGIGESGSADPDKDGLTNDEEKLAGTDPNNPDTDGDGLTDGDEVHKYHTNPLKADTDGDGLSDYDEIMKYHTDPLKVDTDGDGLSDYDEVMKYHTDPLKADTDGDGLSDYHEIMKYHTDPLKADTDGDGLSDGEEVLKYHTDPLKRDTDGGGVDDGMEVSRGSNPLDSLDDFPKPKVEKLEVGKSMVLEGIVFETGKATIAPQSEERLQQALAALKENPEVMVEVRGYTDNVGAATANRKLSLRRAEAVRAWLAEKGIPVDRIGVKGFGPANPIGDNATAEGRAMNRRIEFFRTK
jgi:outer membrane protein OmpA-like peptidoglycan-associated protein